MQLVVSIGTGCTLNPSTRSIIIYMRCHLCSIKSRNFIMLKATTEKFSIAFYVQNNDSNVKMKPTLESIFFLLLKLCLLNRPHNPFDSLCANHIRIVITLFAGVIKSFLLPMPIAISFTNCIRIESVQLTTCQSIHVRLEMVRLARKSTAIFSSIGFLVW